MVFDDVKEAERASERIKKMKDKIMWNQDREFKFHKTNKTQKEEFFSEICELKFWVYATYVDKTEVVNLRGLKAGQFYYETIFDTLGKIINAEEVNIYLDGENGKRRRKRLVADLRKALDKGKKRTTLHFRMRSSDKDVLIQLADMIAGAVRVKYDRKGDYRDYLKMIRDKIKEIYKE